MHHMRLEDLRKDMMFPVPLSIDFIHSKSKQQGGFYPIRKLGPPIIGSALCPGVFYSLVMCKGQAEIFCEKLLIITLLR